MCCCGVYREEFIVLQEPKETTCDITSLTSSDKASAMESNL